jgi:hypothetical protein
MIRKMPVRVFEGWRRFEAVEPFGPKQEDRRAGEIAAVLASIYRDKKQHYNPYLAEEFFPSLQAAPSPDDMKPKKPASPAKLLQIMEAMYLSSGKGEDHRKKRPRYEERDE